MWVMMVFHLCVADDPPEHKLKNGPTFTGRLHMLYLSTTTYTQHNLINNSALIWSELRPESDCVCFVIKNRNHRNVYCPLVGFIISAQVFVVLYEIFEAFCCVDVFVFAVGHTCVL